MMLDLLIKYPLELFAASDWIFMRGWSPWLLGALVVVALPLIWWTLHRNTSREHVKPGQRVAIALLQWLTISLVLFMLWLPALEVKSTDPGDNAITLLIDNSLSMRVEDAAGDLSSSTALSTTGSIDESSQDNTPATQPPSPSSRLGQAVSAIDKSGLLDELGARFSVNFRQFSDDQQATVLQALDGLPAAGETTPLLPAISNTVRDASDGSQAAVIVVSDGGHNTGAVDTQWWNELSTLRVPVYVIAAGQSQLPGDVELDSIDVPQTVAPATTVPLSVSLIYDLPEGVDRATTTVRVRAGDRLIGRDEVVLSATHSRISHTLDIVVPDEGLLQLSVEVDGSSEADDGTLITDPLPGNNRRTRVVSLSETPGRILYVEGEPRWEFKFIRRALENHTSVELVSLLRTSTNKLYRQGVRDETELRDGFPTSREELFSYDALIIGSLEAAYLSGEQQHMVREFVSERGGTLLMLAGKNGLGDGGWGRTEVAQALPAALEGIQPGFVRRRLAVEPSLLGKQAPWLDLSAGSNAEKSGADADWQDLPALADIHHLGEIKSGATVLLQTKPATATNRKLPVLLWQRYGRGKSYLLATSGTWRWQMRLPSEDQRHELFWQGLMNELVQGVLPRLSVSLDQNEYLDTSEVAIAIDARTPVYSPADAEQPKLSLTLPDGTTQSMTATADRSLSGRYQAAIDADNPGVYRLDVTYGEDDEVRETRWFYRQDGLAENFQKRRNQPLLERLAAVTGGAVVELGELEKLPQLIGSSNNLLVRTSQLPLWNMPLLFLLVLIFKMLEWVMRWKSGRV